MSQNNLDDHLARLLNKDPNTGKLNRLEHDVWHKIHAYDLTWQQKIISVFNIPQFQVSALAFALLFGISLSSISNFEFSPNSKVNQHTLDLTLFSANSPYLAVNLIGK
ncbi:MAG: hypothetical protein DHS20C07_30290 [Methyloligella sp.]|jgi:hypothetical protein|nr:MAG: hypothetical protein DHS20C07_30290 [Methyloligella sp.]